MWDRFTICRVWFKLAHDYGLYGIADRLHMMGFNWGMGALELEEHEQELYDANIPLAEATDPWSRKIGE
jgi:hypothetical protein